MQSKKKTQRKWQRRNYPKCGDHNVGHRGALDIADPMLRRGRGSQVVLPGHSYLWNPALTGQRDPPRKALATNHTKDSVGLADPV